MYDFINRFLNSKDMPTETSLDRFFGCKDWRFLREHPNREAAIVEFYIEQIRAMGSFPYVTYTKILKPLHQRAYFHLIYATRSAKGVEKFRDVERRLVMTQDLIRHAPQREHRIGKTGQDELFFGEPESLSSAVERERAAQRDLARAKLFSTLEMGPCRYGSLLPTILQIPLFWKAELNEMLEEERQNGRVIIEGMMPRQRIPKDDCLVRLKRTS